MSHMSGVSYLNDPFFSFFSGARQAWARMSAMGHPVDRPHRTAQTGDKEAIRPFRISQQPRSSCSSLFAPFSRRTKLPGPLLGRRLCSLGRKPKNGSASPVLSHEREMDGAAYRKHAQYEQRKRSPIPAAQIRPLLAAVVVMDGVVCPFPLISLLFFSLLNLCLVSFLSTSSACLVFLSHTVMHACFCLVV